MHLQDYFMEVRSNQSGAFSSDLLRLSYEDFFEDDPDVNQVFNLANCWQNLAAGS